MRALLAQLRQHVEGIALASLQTICKARGLRALRRQFKRRSLDRINEIQEQAGTVLMVTHQMREIQRTCSRVIWLDDGVIVADGPTDRVLEEYLGDED